MPKKKTTLDFEKDLQELENLVKKMEQGELSLQDSLVQFERGIMLTRACQKTLAEAEQKIHILLKKDNSQTLQPFSLDAHANDNEEDQASD